jgi:membrane protein YqaA with SNARE-associated domain
MQETLTSIWGLFLSAFISSTVAPGGSEAVLAYMVSQGHFQVQNLVIVAAIGNTLGAMTTWGLGMFAAKKFPLASLLSEKKQNALKIVRTRGVWVLFFSWLPLVGDALCFAGGWLKLPLLPACLVILAGKLGRYAVIAWMFI